jgi:ADP-ribose pyrophosphatase YjhB (NUDIX family)
LFWKKDGKFLLVQEGKVDIGEWNIPAGWLDLNEDIMAGAIRETKEETGLDVELTGFLGVYASAKKGKIFINHAIRFIFTAKALNEELNPPKGEILDARWFAYEELKVMSDQGILRSRTILPQVEDYLAGKIYSMDAIKPFISRV